MHSRNPNEKPRNLQPSGTVSVSDKHILPRFLISAVLFVVGGIAIWYGCREMNRVSEGIQTVTANTSKEASVAGDFTFYYDFGKSGQTPQFENKKLVSTYTDLGVKAYRIFQTEKTFDGVGSLYELNAHPNEWVTLDQALYQALSVFKSSENGERILFLAPVFEIYKSVFGASYDEEARLQDPAFSREMKAYVEELRPFVTSEDHCTLELDEENRARICLSQTYRKYLEDNEIAVALDFCWLKNAVIVDYLADSLVGEGFRYGMLISSDGFCRSFDESNTAYTMTVLDRRDDRVRTVAGFRYSGSMSLVTLKGFPASEQDEWTYYVYEDGTVRVPYLSADGISACHARFLAGHSDTASATEIGLLLSAWMTGSFDEDSMKEADQLYGIRTAAIRDLVFFRPDEDGWLMPADDSGAETYTIKLIPTAK